MTSKEICYDNELGFILVRGVIFEQNNNTDTLNKNFRIPELFDNVQDFILVCKKIEKKRFLKSKELSLLVIKRLEEKFSIKIESLDEETIHS